MPGSFNTIASTYGSVRPALPFFGPLRLQSRITWLADVYARGLLMKPPTEHRNDPLVRDQQERQNLVSNKDTKQKFRDFIYLINLHRSPDGTSLYGEPLFSYVMFPFIPLEIEVTPESVFSPIPIIGRNNPPYHYAGSEDTIELRIDWFAQEDSLEDVILSCRWVESLSKSDGYDNPPPVVKLVWSNGDRLFRNHYWIVAKASYSLSQFQPNRNLLPRQAYQIIQLKRVTDHNLTHDDINRI